MKFLLLFPQLKHHCSSHPTASPLRSGPVALYSCSKEPKHWSSGSA